MGHHTFDADSAADLEAPERRYCVLSAEELRWALDCAPDDTVADLGSGTGFYTDDVAPHAGEVYAVDWAAGGEGERGPPPTERYSLDEAVATLREHGFEIEFEVVRPETFLLIATAE
jgi:hypothetical protein